jgi:hypothetical protein
MVTWKIPTWIGPSASCSRPGGSSDGKVEGGHDREALRRASKAIDEAFDLMGGVALSE